jgi:mono/diheme cytochrome c family protein
VQTFDNSSRYIARAEARAAVLGARQHRKALTVALLGLGIAALGMLLPAPPSHAADPISFKTQVQPIFDQNCVSCHTSGQLGTIASHLDLTSYAGLRAGSNRGVEVIPGHADRSPMMKLVDDNWHSTATDVLKMPPFGPQLTADQLATLRDWINQGAPDN